MTAEPASQGRLTNGSAALLLPLLAGAAVALTLGVYGRIHEPTGIAVGVAGFSSLLTVKVWLATVALAFAVVQVASALVMFGKVPHVTSPTWIGALHRWSGRIAFLLTVPVAVQCLYAFGFSTFSTRTLIHSLTGCLFFGAFTVKMLSLPRRGLPALALPVLGGVVFAAVVVIWVTSALWFFTTSGVKL